MRYVLVIIGLLAVIGGLVFVKYSQIAMLIGFGKQMEAAGPPPQAVATMVAQEQDWEGTLSAVGTVASMKGVTISAEAAGVVTRINFESGKRVKQGEVLVELDTSVERAQLASAKVRSELAKSTAERTRVLTEAGAKTKVQAELDDSSLKSATAEIAVLQAQIAKKTIRAPFSGKLGIRSVNLGQYLNPGTPVTVLEATDGVFVDFTLPQQQAVTVGMKVRITVEGIAKLDTEGVVEAIDPNVDQTTRSLKVRASAPNADEKLQPGMFANIALVLPERPKVVTVPLIAVIHASFGDSVFILEEPENKDAKGPGGEPVKMARQQFVRLGDRQGDFVAVLDGVKAGQEVVSQGAFKLRNKAPVYVNNADAAKPELNPKPENK